MELRALNKSSAVLHHNNQGWTLTGCGWNRYQERHWGELRIYALLCWGTWSSQGTRGSVVSIVSVVCRLCHATSTVVLFPLNKSFHWTARIC